MKKRFLSLFCVLALCLGLLPTTALADAVVVVPPGGGDGDISVDVNPDEPGNVTVIVPGEDGGDVVVVIPPDEEEPKPPAIGDVVNFAGHEWYIIGDETEGVTAPAGCYTLFAKNNDFGSTTFRAGADDTDSTANYYKDSDLQKAMNEIANGFSDAEKANIFPRTLDNIAGDVVENQLVWPIGMQNSAPGTGGVNGEAALINQSVRKFDQAYWTRTNFKGGVFVFTEETDGHVETSKSVYDVFGITKDGNSTYVAGSSGVNATTVTDTLAVRPAMYVKADAFTGGAEASSVLGDTVSFAGHEWYIIGTGLGGVTAPEGCYTLFAKYDDFGSTVFRAGANDGNSTANHYKDSDLQNKMEEIANSSLSAYKEDIVARATLDGIAGDSPTDQLLWPISKAEWESIDQSVRAFPADYWTRAYYSGNTDRGGPVYRGWKALADGSILGGTLGPLSSFGNYVGDTNAVRPLLLAGEERMTLGTDIQTNVLLGGTGLKLSAASTLDNRRLVLGMNTFFHYCHLISSFHRINKLILPYIPTKCKQNFYLFPRHLKPAFQSAADVLVNLHRLEAEGEFRRFLHNLQRTVVQHPGEFPLVLGGGQADGREHDAPPVVSRRRADEHPHGLVLPCRQGEVVVDPGVEPGGAHLHPHRIIVPAAGHFRLGGFLQDVQVFLSGGQGLFLGFGAGENLRPGGQDAVPHPELQGLVGLGIRVGQHMQPQDVLPDLAAAGVKAHKG